MKKLEEKQMDDICGGNETLSGPIISALTSVIKALREAGISFGSGIRRISENNLCPLE